MKFKILPLVGLVLSLGAGFGSAVYAFAVETDFDQGIADSMETPEVEEGAASSLAVEASQALASESAVALQLLQKKSQRKLILEEASFARGNGIVLARGAFWDAGGPREIRMFVDAYGSGSLPIASFPFDFTSNGQRQPIEVKVRDYPSFKKFSFRFTHDGVALDVASPNDAGPKLSGVSPQAMLFHSDYGELRELLTRKGYIEDESFEPEAMLGAVRRFRAEEGLPGPGFVTLGDLFALRIVNNVEGGATSLEPYVEWSSGSGGGRMEARETFAEKDSEESDKPAEESGRDIYADMEPTAEEDAGLGQR